MRRRRLDALRISSKSKVDDEKAGVGSEELSEELPEESVCEASSDSDNDGTEQSIEELCEELEEDSTEEPSSDNEHEFSEEDKGEPTEEPFDESVRINSNEKKRPLDARSGKSGSLEVYQIPKKCKPEQSLKPKLDVGPVVTDPRNECGTPNAFCNDGNASEQQENTGSSGKRRRSRWDLQPEGDGEGNEGEKTSKRRKTKWADDDSQLKMLGPVKLPDFVKELVAATIADPEIQELNMRLSIINSKLKGSELQDDRPEEERSPSPPPVYDNLGFRMNSRDVRLRETLIRERQAIISRLIQKNPAFRSPPPEPKPPKFYKKLYIPVREYPGYNFVGLIIGPRGNTQKRMEKETGAKIVLRGKGSVKEKVGQKKPDPSDNDDLHVLVEADNQKSLDEAVGMVEKLLIPVDKGMNDHKRAQLKELAKINGTLKDENLCRVCGEEGHKNYACPNQSSSFSSSCNRCCRSHLSFTCPFMAPTLGSNVTKNGLGTSPSYCSYSHPGVGSTPPTSDSKTNKEVDDTNLFVGYLPQTVDENRLMELFSPFGRLIEAKVIKDRNTGFSKGYGFVKYNNPINAAAAVATMNGYPIDGKILAVKLAGNPPAAGSSPSITQLPKYPTAVSQDNPSQTAWPGPPGSMLPEPRTPFYNSDSLGLPPLSVFPGHGDSSGKKLPSSHGSSSYQIPISSPSSLAWFPGNRDGDSSGKKLPSSHGSSSSYQIPLSSPSSLPWFPGHPDYRSSSHFQSYFNTPTSSHSPQFYLTQSLSSRLTPLSYSPSSERYESCRI
ncbi:RNA recognition motif domain [Macleaya cordata]|uniref:Branchpoint-bridging protein n=1 Tax=Macleaya cordata TaxID=56857 RepID=A0A200QUF0_MACCD|nr:RNA recognition motif domain [Macleaya cordata]